MINPFSNEVSRSSFIKPGKAMQWGLRSMLVITTCALWMPTQASILWQSNSAGNDIHLFEVDSLELIDRLVVGSNPHGLATDAEQNTVYATLEKNGEESGELLWIDTMTRTIQHRLEIGPEPHQLAVSPDGAWAYVPCRDEHYWVIDTIARKVVKKIYTGGRPHNTTITADGRYAYLSPMGSNAQVTVVSIDENHGVVGHIQFSNSVRPPTITRKGDYLFQHIDGLNGFEVADTASRQLVGRIEHSSSLGWFLMRPKSIGWLSSSGLKRCHGLAVSPDDEEVWSVCGNYLAIHSATTPYQERALVELPAKAYWLTFSPDGRRAFVALSEMNQVVVLDAKERKVRRLIDVGQRPKRNLVLK